MAGDVGGRSCTDAELLLHPELLSQEFLLLTLEQVGRSGPTEEDGQPGGQAGLREARGCSPPTLIRWGLPPLIPNGNLLRVTGIPRKPSITRKGCLRQPPLPVCKQRPAEEID